MGLFSHHDDHAKAYDEVPIAFVGFSMAILTLSSITRLNTRPSSLTR